MVVSFVKYFTFEIYVRPLTAYFVISRIILALSRLQEQNRRHEILSSRPPNGNRQRMRKWSIKHNLHIVCLRQVNCTVLS